MPTLVVASGFTAPLVRLRKEARRTVSKFLPPALLVVPPSRWELEFLRVPRGLAGDIR